MIHYFQQIEWYFEEINGNKYSTLVPTNESKEIINFFEELCNKIRDLIRSITKNSYDYDDNYMKIKSNSDDDLPLNKKIEISIMTIAVIAVNHENNKYYPQVFLDERCINYKCYILIELMFLKVLVLIKQVNQKSLMIVTIGIF